VASNQRTFDNISSVNKCEAHQQHTMFCINHRRVVREEAKNQPCSKYGIQTNEKKKYRYGDFTHAIQHDIQQQKTMVLLQ
jgi:hypothetical protein